jgi:4,5-dihydroxyphthalate decarboxylase
VATRATIGLTSNPRTRALIDGRAPIRNVEAITSVVHPAELFFRQLHHAEFDLAEMSLSTFLMLRARGDGRFVGLPVFTTRRMFHTLVLVRRDRGIDRPSDLRGKRVGVHEYQQTAALWIRGVLDEEFGVKPSDMEFWMERLPAQSHASGVGFKPPAGVSIHQIPEHKNIGEMMLAGELDAVIFYIKGPTAIDRSSVDLAIHPEIKPLFEDNAAEAARYFRKTGIFPINHMMVMKRSLYDAAPETARAVVEAAVAADQAARADVAEFTTLYVETGAMLPAARAALREPVATHGILANRAVIEKAVEYSFQQGLTPRRMRLDEVFAPSVLGT